MSENPDGGRQVFGAVARTDTDIAALIRRSLETVGQTAGTKLGVRHRTGRKARFAARSENAMQRGLAAVRWWCATV